MADGSDRTLRKRTQPPISNFFIAAPTKVSKPPKTRQEINKAYYEKVKAEKPEQYNERIKTQVSKSKKYREALKEEGNEEKLKESREKAKLRVREYRKRQKEKKLSEPAPATKNIMTRKDKEALDKKKEAERLRKQKERENWSHQKLTAERAKNRARYHKNKKTSKNNIDTESQTEATSTESQTKATSSLTREALYQATYRGRKALPKDQEARKETLITICEKEGLTVVEQEDESSAIMPRVWDRTLNRKLGKHLLTVRGKRQAARKLKEMMGFSRKRMSYFKTKKLKVRCDAKKKAVREFFVTHARTLPDRKTAKDGEPKYVLEESIDSLFKEFKRDSSVEVGRSFFFKHRPSQVKTMKDLKFNQSLCEPCENFRLTLEVLGKFHSTFKGDKTTVVDHFLCVRSGKYNKKACLNRTCNTCGTPSLEGLFSEEDLAKEVPYQQWVSKGEGEESKKKMLDTSVTALRNVADNFLKQMKTLPLHLFIAKWQYSEFTKQHKEVQAGTAISVLDFAENYRCSSQDEVQSAYWHYRQATLHPIVNYLWCDTCNIVKTHTIVFISDHLEHDSHAVEAFWAKNLSLLRQTNTVDISRQWSDGCGAQYKSRMPFGYIQAGPKHYGLRILERNFFGSRHGKNPSDGVSAVVKGRATRAVKCRRATIQSAEDLYLFAEKNLTVKEDCKNHAARTFVFVPKGDIVKPKFTTTTLKGTRKLHNVRALGDLLWHRNLSCLCSGCEANQECNGGDYIEPWQKHNMLPLGAENVHGIEQVAPVEEMSTSTLEYLESLTDELALNSSLSISQEMSVLVPDLPATDQSTPHAEPNGHPADPAATDPPAVATLQLQSGTWVVAKFPGKKAASGHSFLGVILSVEEGEANIKFCKRNGRWFTWPVNDDTGWMPFYALTATDPPSMDARERMFLSKEQLDLF